MIGYDAVDWQAIPAAAEMVLGYIDGSWPWPREAWDKFAHAIRVTIITNPRHNAGEVYDCEPGNGSPFDAGPWAKMRNASGRKHPCIYCDKNDWLAVRYSVALARATGVVYWIADPPARGVQGHPHSIPGAVGCQYAFATNLPPELHGRNIDISVFDDVTWLPTTAFPAGWQTPNPSGEDDMFDETEHDKLDTVYNQVQALRGELDEIVNNLWPGLGNRLTGIENMLTQLVNAATVPPIPTNTGATPNV